MKKVTTFLTTIITLLALSCNKETIKSDGAITFTAEYTATTKANTAFAENNKAKIFVYETSKIAEEVLTPYKEFEATSTHNAGTASLVPATALVLPKNTYDFHCFSYNTTDVSSFALLPPAKKQVEISNGQDFLAAKVTNQAISAAQNIAFNLQHKCVAIALSFAPKAEQGITALTVKSATATLPATTAKYNIIDGTFVNATAFSPTFTSVPVATNATSFIVVPTTPGADKMQMKIICDVTIQGVAYTNREYSFTLTQNEFVSGKNYIYSAAIGSNEITFTGATVEDWTEVPSGNLDGSDNGNII